MDGSVIIIMTVTLCHDSPVVVAVVFTVSSTDVSILSPSPSSAEESPSPFCSFSASLLAANMSLPNTLRGIISIKVSKISSCMKYDGSKSLRNSLGG